MTAFIIGTAASLFIVIDPFGNIPTVLALLQDVSPQRRRRVILREHLIALATLVIFLFFGAQLLSLVKVESSSLEIGGGLVIFIIALRMIFPLKGGVFTDEQVPGEPLIVPIAIPLIAGPASIAAVMLLATDVGRRPLWASLIAVILAWLGSLAVLSAASAVIHLLGMRVLAAIQRLMGMILVIIAVQMCLQGIREIVQSWTVV